MEFIKYEVADSVAVLAMNRPKANALHMAMLSEMRQAVDSALANADVRALVLTSAVPKFFSAGFDVAEVFQYDRPRMSAFLEAYGSFATTLRTAPKPVIASIAGHCYAGGTILALCCDFRLIAAVESGIALNEINLGVVLPRGVFELAAEVVGVGPARRMILTGDPVAPDRALATGLVDEVCAPEALSTRTHEFAAALAIKPPSVFAAVKKLMRGSGIVLMPEIEPWFTPEAQERKRALFATLKK